jgi:hypothetical protein
MFIKIMENFMYKCGGEFIGRYRVVEASLLDSRYQVYCLERLERPGILLRIRV